MSEPADATAGTWHDQAPAVADAAADQLRLSGTDPDIERLEPLARSACSAIDSRLCLTILPSRVLYTVGGIPRVTYATDDAPPDVLAAAVQLTRELFQRKDAPFGIANAWSPNGEPLRISRDQLAGVSSLLEPYVEGWGVG